MLAEPEVLQTNPLTVSFKYKDNATWSDGKPVTGADFVATWQVFINPAFNVVSRTGFEDMKSVKANGKTSPSCPSARSPTGRPTPLSVSSRLTSSRART